MTIPLYSWITAKIKIWSKDAANKGYKRVFLENLQEFVQKRTFKKLGVLHPHNSVGLSETISKSEHKDAHENMPSSFYSLKQAFKTLPIPFEDICMLDIGCGSGRVLTYGMILSFKRVVGIDLDEKGIEKAIENCLQLQMKGYDTLFDIQVADATQFEIPAYINLIYLFNPFGGATLSKVCENIHAHCKKNRHACLYHLL